MVAGAIIVPYDIRIKKHAESTLALQKLSYKKEAELIGYPNLPPLHQTLEDLQLSGETFIGHFEESNLTGAISFICYGSIIDIHRLVVHPAHFQKGIAQALLNDVIAHSKDAERLIVSTGTENAPAIRFYLKNGFQVKKQTKLEDGLQLTHFERVLLK